MEERCLLKYLALYKMYILMYTVNKGSESGIPPLWVEIGFRIIHPWNTGSDVIAELFT